MRLAAYQPDIAQNLGALIRLCACMDTPLDVIEPCGFPFSSKAVRRVAMDYADLAKITRHDSWEMFQKDKPPGRLILLTTKGGVDIWDFEFQSSDTLLVGRESAGVPESVHNIADARLTIPMPGGGRSLNVGHSAAIAVAEAHRQLTLSAGSAG